MHFAVGVNLKTPYFQFLLILLMTSSASFALNSSKCSEMLNKGLYKTYKYGGVGEAAYNAITEGTKKDGSTVASSESSTTEPTTATFDPKYSTNVSRSETQSSSSWGDCSLFAMREELLKQRDVYITQNYHEILNETSRGQGEHLKVIAFYSLCEDSAALKLSSALQAKFADILATTTDQSSNKYSRIVDTLILNDPMIKQSCPLRFAQAIQDSKI